MLSTMWAGISIYVWPILGTILTTIASYVGLKIKAIYQAKADTETKRKIVEDVVKMVEQVAVRYGWTGEEKLKQAKDAIIKLSAMAGITVTDLELDVLIESVCSSFSKSLKTSV